MDIQKVEEENLEGKPKEIVENLDEKTDGDPSDSFTNMEEEPKEAETEKEHPFMILLPEEVRGEIYNKLPQSDILPLRLVCQQWRDEIDRSVDYSLEFGERRNWEDDDRALWSLPSPKAVQKELNRRTERLLQFRIKDCILNDNLKIEYPSLVLKYPKLMKTLEIKMGGICNSLTECRCPLEHYDQLLKSCAKYLVKLTMSDVSPVMLSLSPEYPPYDLQALKTLKVTHNGMGIDFGNVSVDRVTLKTIPQDILFNNFISSSLKTLNIQVNSMSTKPDGLMSHSCLNGIVKLIGSSWKTLEDLELLLLENVEPGKLGLETNSEISTANWTLFQKVQNLKTVCLMVNWCQLTSGLLKLLENQKELEKVHLKMPLYSSVAIRNNSRTLVFVELEPQGGLFTRYGSVKQALGPGGLYDLSDFQNCQNLKHLTLNNSEEQRDFILRPHPKLVNFHLLPKSLETLKIFQFLVSSSEIAAFFADENSCTSLETVLLTCGKSMDGFGEFGVNYEAFAAILRGLKPNLKKLDITEFNIRNQVELIKIVSHLEGIGTLALRYQNIRKLSISFKRKSSDDPWNQCVFFF